MSTDRPHFQNKKGQGPDQGPGQGCRVDLAFLPSLPPRQTTYSDNPPRPRHAFINTTPSPHPLLVPPPPHLLIASPLTLTSFLPFLGSQLSAVSSPHTPALPHPRPSSLVPTEGAGTRTRDLRIKSPLLYQLSYAFRHSSTAEDSRRRHTTGGVRQHGRTAANRDGACHREDPRRLRDCATTKRERPAKLFHRGEPCSPRAAHGLDSRSHRSDRDAEARPPSPTLFFFRFAATGDPSRASTRAPAVRTGKYPASYRRSDGTILVSHTAAASSAAIPNPRSVGRYLLTGTSCSSPTSCPHRPTMGPPAAVAERSRRPTASDADSGIDHHQPRERRELPHPPWGEPPTKPNHQPTLNPRTMTTSQMTKDK